eukprot:TRINITY_DN1341_c0_g1_i1.p1 TRINITY_DN1341_c0_g1~~TRINITY_DN1341_c0_g1_i1.p1  ORF type:complete len:514 (+),score=117.31 TRINITY_DN1341_c0_g1_i1:83-1624(+)
MTYQATIFSFLDQKTALCCVIDEQGEIVFKNKSWELFVLENHFPATPFQFRKTRKNYFAAQEPSNMEKGSTEGEPFEISLSEEEEKRFLSSLREAFHSNSFDLSSKPLKPLYCFPPGSHFVAPRIRDKKELHEHDSSEDHMQKDTAPYSQLIFAPSRSSSASESGSPSDSSSPRPTEPEREASHTVFPSVASSSPLSPQSPPANSSNTALKQNFALQSQSLISAPLLTKTKLNLKYNVSNSHLNARLKLSVKKLLLDKSWLTEDKTNQQTESEPACFLILEHKLVRLKKLKQTTPSSVLPLKSVTELDEFFKIVDTFSCHCCLVDLSGKIIYTNPAWNIFCMENGGQPHYYLGHNYLQLGSKKAKPPAGCGSTAKEEEEDLLGELMGELEDGFGFMEGLKRIVDGHTLQEFQLIYPCHSPRELRFFLACGFGLFIGGERYIFVSHELISKGEKNNSDSQNQGEKEREQVKEWQLLGEREKRKRSVDHSQQQQVGHELWGQIADPDDLEAATER